MNNKRRLSGARAEQHRAGRALTDGWGPRRGEAGTWTTRGPLGAMERRRRDLDHQGPGGEGPKERRGTGH